jgi:hypothetical protein
MKLYFARHGESEANVQRIQLPHLLSNVDRAYSMARPFDGSFYVIAELHDGEWACLRWGQEIL